MYQQGLIFLPKFKKKKKKTNYDNDGSKNSSLDYYICEQGSENIEYDL